MRYFLIIMFLFKKVCGCDYDSCTNAEDGVLNVHIVAHTHNDVGWRFTVDEYYEDQVSRILDSVITELWNDPKRKFMYVEIAFFWKWWGNQERNVKDKVHTLVNEGRLKFVGGAWTMNDEATTNYQSIIDQFSWGLKKLNDTFGKCAIPKVAWQIDPFGHSREFASLLAAMGYDGVFLCRIDNKELDERRETKTMEFLWRGDDNLGSSSDIFAGVLYQHYDSPRGFNFNSDSIIQYRYSIFEQQKDEKIRMFFEHVHNISNAYATNNILIPMGDDFAFTDAFKWFSNLDFLIEAANKKASEENLNIKVFYSTPDCYLKAVKIANPTLPIKQDDFFPYINEHGYWTGFYTSKPSIKVFERDANRYLQMIKQLYIIAGLEENDDEDNSLVLDELRSAMGVMQHHDAITGTNKQYVAENYKHLLHQAVQNSLLVADRAFTKFAGHYYSNNNIFQFKKCQLNESQCDTSEKSLNFIANVYNPLAWEQVEIEVIVPVTHATYVVYDSDGNKVNAKLVPILNWYRKNIPNRQSFATHELIFTAKNIPPLGFRSFYFQTISTSANYIMPRLEHTNYDEILIFGTSVISHVESGYYDSSKSGAYVFSPNNVNPTTWYNLTLKEINDMRYNTRQNVSAVIKNIKKYKNNSIVLQIQWLCKPIHLNDNYGKEVVVRYHTNIENNGEFYTDSNGRQMIQRQKSKILQHFYKTNSYHVAVNYFPVSNKIFIKDNKSKFTIITDRAEGGYSPKTGIIELMLDRQLVLHESEMAMGLDEPLYQEGLVNVINHFIMISDVADKQSKINEKILNFEINLSPIILFSDATDLSLDEWLMMKQFSAGLKRDLPEGLHLLTLEPWGKWQLLLRLENYLERSDRSDTSIVVDICDIFTTITLKSMKETTLSGNQWLREKETLFWNKREDFSETFDENSNRNNSIFNCSNILILSKEIRTFIVNYEIKESFYK